MNTWIHNALIKGFRIMTVHQQTWLEDIWPNTVCKAVISYQNSNTNTCILAQKQTKNVQKYHSNSYFFKESLDKLRQNLYNKPVIQWCKHCTDQSDYRTAPSQAGRGLKTVQERGHSALEPASLSLEKVSVWAVQPTPSWSPLLLPFIWTKSSWWIVCRRGPLSRVRSKSLVILGVRVPFPHWPSVMWTLRIKASEIWEQQRTNSFTVKTLTVTHQW